MTLIEAAKQACSCLFCNLTIEQQQALLIMIETPICIAALAYVFFKTI